MVSGSVQCYKCPMKTLIALFAIVISTSAFADESFRKLVCTGTNFDDLGMIEVYENGKTGELTVIETADNGTKTTNAIPFQALADKDIPLSNWNGYDRHVYKDGSDWVLEHRDECSGGYSFPNCKEENVVSITF